jgi:hypothetical protein
MMKLLLMSQSSGLQEAWQVTVACVKRCDDESAVLLLLLLQLLLATLSAELCLGLFGCSQVSTVR